MVNADRIDVPVRFRESLRVVSYEVDATVSATGDGLVLRAVGVVSVNFSGLVAAEIGVDDDAHVAEVLVDFARPLLVHCRPAEVRDVWCAA